MGSGKGARGGLAAFAACAVAASAVAVAGTAATSAARPTAADLALMVIPLARLKEVDGAKATVAGSSGPIDVAEAAYRTIDPRDTAADLRRRGFVAGYDLGASWSSGKLLAVTSSVLLFRDEAAARTFARQQVADNARFSGKPIPPLGVTVTSGETSQADGLGADARASVGRLELEGTKWTAGAITFVVGSVVASLTGARTDEGDLRRALDANARLLRERVVAVGGGERLDGPPTLRPSGEFTVARKPAGAPALDAIAFGPADLPAGAVVRSSGWISTPGISGFASRLRPAVKPIGSSYVSELQVTLLRSDDLAGARDTFRSMAEPSFFGALIERTARLSTVRRLKLTLESRRSLEVGDEAATVSWRLETPIGPARIVLLVTRRGKLVEALVASGSTRMLAERDLEGLLRAAAQRLGAG